MGGGRDVPRNSARLPALVPGVIVFRYLLCMLCIAAGAGAGAAAAQTVDPRAAAAMREALVHYPDAWEAVEGQAIVYRPNGFTCRAQLGHTFLETVMTAPDGGICIWSDGGDIRILIGAKRAGDETLLDAAQTAADIVGGETSADDLDLVGRFIEGCPGLTARVSWPHVLDSNLFVARQGGYHWVTLAMAALNTPDSANALPGAISLRDAYLRSQTHCEPLG